MTMTRPERIAHAIEDSGQTPAAVARLIGCTSAAVYQWIRGETKDIKNDLLFALADATGFHARWIATGEGPAKLTEDVRARRLAELFQSLDDRGKDAVFRIAEAESSYSVKPEILQKRSA